MCRTAHRSSARSMPSRDSAHPEQGCRAPAAVADLDENQLAVRREQPQQPVDDPGGEAPEEQTPPHRPCAPCPSPPRRAATTAPMAAHAITVVTTGVRAPGSRPSTPRSPDYDRANDCAPRSRHRTLATKECTAEEGSTLLRIDNTSVRSASTTASASSPGRSGPLREPPLHPTASRARLRSARTAVPEVDLRCAQWDSNVLGGELKRRLRPLTASTRRMLRQRGDDHGVHTVCAVMTPNSSPSPARKGTTQHAGPGFPGSWRATPVSLRVRWQEAYEAGVAPPVRLEATHARTLEWCSLSALQAHAASR